MTKPTDFNTAPVSKTLLIHDTDDQTWALVTKNRAYGAIVGDTDRMLISWFGSVSEPPGFGVGPWPQKMVEDFECWDASHVVDAILMRGCTTLLITDGETERQTRWSAIAARFAAMLEKEP